MQLLVVDQVSILATGLKSPTIPIGSQNEGHTIMPRRPWAGPKQVS
jgi:hypothetical protein